MRYHFLSLWTALILLSSGVSPSAQFAADPLADESMAAAPSAAEAAVHAELVAMREAIVKAINTKDIDGLLTHVHPDVVVIWQNAVISRGHAGVREYYQEALGGPKAVLESYTVEPRVQELTIMHGDDMGIAYGTILCHFKFKNGRQFDLEGPWSATMVLSDGEWKIASFHASSGLFDNPLLLAAKSWLYKACGASLLVGMGAAAVGMAVFRGRRKGA